MGAPATDTGRLLELAERCEQATGPDRELDDTIFEVLGIVPSRGDGLIYPHYAYTASIDAAMTLVPEGAKLQFQNFGDTRRRAMWLVSPNERFMSAATPALALCAAALRARAASATGEGL